VDQRGQTTLGFLHGLRISCGAAIVALASLAFFGGSIDSRAAGAEPSFTGERLTILYVKDVRRSAAFYLALGFRLDHYYDYDAETYSRNWTKPEPPDWAEMQMGKSVRIGLTTAEEENQVYGGGARHYFIIENVEDHFLSVKAQGITPEPDEIEKRPWMDFFTISDPDGHQIVFGRKNQVYYDEVRKRIDALAR
jgi:catechol 2,3-dioxygenase-like lactoylglutathione lyase family enzyme